MFNIPTDGQLTSSVAVATWIFLAFTVVLSIDTSHGLETFPWLVDSTAVVLNMDTSRGLETPHSLVR